MEKQPQSASDQKVEEYITRIKNGESKVSIMEGLPPSFVSRIEAGLNQTENTVESDKDTTSLIPPQYKGLDSEILEFIWTIPEYIDSEKTKQEKEKKKQAIEALKKQESSQLDIQKRKLTDEIKIEEIRNNLDIGSEELVLNKQQELASLEESEKEEKNLVTAMVKYFSNGRSEAVVDLYKRLSEDIQNPESRRPLVSALFQEVYNKYRRTDYPNDPYEEKTWEDAFKNKKVDIDNQKKEWMYRGMFPQKGQETLTRCSFNVNVTPELIDSLDEMIAQGKIKANYKFGQPGSMAAPTDRHDSISMYFLEEPSDEALQELSQIIKPYVRGDNLLGKKISDGFFMSEIGSIETKHIESFVEDLKSKDPAFAEALKIYTSPKPGEGKSLKMSEAQYYAVKDVAHAFGYDISYTKDSGFEIK